MNIKIIINIIFGIFVLIEIGFMLSAPYRRNKELKDYNLKNSPAADSCMLQSIKSGLIALLFTIFMQTIFNLI